MERQGLVPEALRRVRNAAILREVLLGESCKAVGQKYALTAAGVRYVVWQECYRRNPAAARHVRLTSGSLAGLRAQAAAFAMAALATSPLDTEP